MAHFNQQSTQKNGFLKVGDLFQYTSNGNTYNVSSTTVGTSSNTYTSTVLAPSPVFHPDHLGKLLVFGNGRTKAITGIGTAANANTLLSNTCTVEPNFPVRGNVEFSVYETSMFFNNDGNIVLGDTTIPTELLSEKGVDLNYGRIVKAPMPKFSDELASKRYVDGGRKSVFSHMTALVGDGSNTTFGIPEPLSINSSIVSVGGALQNPNESYTFTGNSTSPTITFTEAPPSGTSINIRGTESQDLTNAPNFEEIFDGTTNTYSSLAVIGEGTGRTDGTNRRFHLRNEVLDKNNLLVTIDGVVQKRDIITVTPTAVRMVFLNNTANTYAGGEYKLVEFDANSAPPANTSVQFIQTMGARVVPNKARFIEITANTVNVKGESITSNNFIVTSEMLNWQNGLLLYVNVDPALQRANTGTVIELPEMDYSDEGSRLKIRGVRANGAFTVVSHSNNYLQWESAPGYLYSPNMSNYFSELCLEYESGDNQWNSWRIVSPSTGMFAVANTMNGARNEFVEAANNNIIGF